MRTIGVDLGGTSVKLGVTEEGVILKTRVIPVAKDGSYKTLLGDIADACRALASEYGAKRIGIGSPGLVDTVSGSVCYSNNIVMREVSFKDDLAKATALPVRIANDAKCAALGEAKYGAGKGSRRVLMLTLGTGVGGGFAVDGRLTCGDIYADASDIFGHLTLVPNGRPCTCGRRGCLEAYCSATALSAIAEERFGYAVSAKELFSLYQERNAIAEEILDAFARDLGNAAVSLANILRPERILFGGGVSDSAAMFLPKVNEMLEQEVFGAEYAPVKAYKATLGNRAGLVGAAALWEE